ncbi:MAG: TolC family protein [Bacteroidaceae bacterium]|nr:TolC family protein [Bacteroidaceae bacterium]
MKRIAYLFAAAVCFALSGCGIYNKYQSTAEVPTDAYGADVVTTDGSLLAEMSWRDFFTDPLLQQLIDTALVRNTDLNSARIAVEKSEASLRAAKLAYLPSLYFAPSGSMSSFDNGPVSKAYNLPLQLSMDLDVFGSITSQKRRSKAVLLQAQAQEEAIRANVVSSVAQHYILLLVLDRQMEILTSTDSLWNASLETQKSLWENGKSYSTAVNQMESSYLNVKTQLIDTKRAIRQVENELCRLLAITPQHIQRKRWGNYELPHQFSVGVPAELLTHRPDVRMAEHAMEEAFYNTQAARAAFYPSITLQGDLGWTNNAGTIVDPGKLLWNAVASLTQPIFARGKLIANLKVNKLTQEDVQNRYVQTVIDAGNQVNEAMADCQAAKEKDVFYKRQVAVLKDAYNGTHELMDNGKASYLEVLTAQESLLNAQLNEAMNLYDGSQALIALYIALGGGIK